MIHLQDEINRLVSESPINSIIVGNGIEEKLLKNNKTLRQEKEKDIETEEDSDKDENYCSDVEEIPSNPYSALKNFIEDDASKNVDVSINKKDLIIRILKHVVAHNTSKSEMRDMLRLFNGAINIRLLPDTDYFIDKYFNPDLGTTYHAICNKCEIYVSTFVSGEEHILCPQCKKQIDLKNERCNNYFITFNVISDFQFLLKKYGSYYKYVVEDRKHEKNVLKDFYDGIMYRKFVTSLPEHMKHRYVTCILNTDGSPTFKSSNFAIWPVHLLVPETPKEVRSNEVILYGLWFGKSKPKMKMFLTPLVKEFNYLSKVGIPCEIEKEKLTIYPHIICCCVDSAARPPMQGIHQYNGAFGCSWCLHPGNDETLKSLKYPILKTPSKPRTHKGCIADIEKLNELKKTYEEQNLSTKKLHVRGFINDTPLKELSHYNMVKSFVPDFLHCGLFGVARQFCRYWFGSGKFGFTIRKSRNEIDELLNKQIVNSAAQKLPRTVQERRHWKAMEFLNWLIYYSVPMICQFLEKKYVDHWLLLVEGMYILLQNEITFDELNHSKRLIESFQRGAQRLYGVTSMTSNVHQLTHLVESVFNWGPLPAHNGFPFENANGLLLNTIHGAKGVKEQISRAIGFRKCLRYLESDLNDSEYEYVGTKLRYTKKSFKLGNHRYFGKSYVLSKHYCDQFPFLSKNYETYERMLKKSRIFSTRENNKRTNNSFALLNSKKNSKTYVKIEKILIDKINNNEICLVRTIQTKSAFGHLHSGLKTVIQVSDKIRAVSTTNLYLPCMFMRNQSQAFIIAMPDTFYY